jgi:transcriptional regulator with XRE-family HTH domain
MVDAHLSSPKKQSRTRDLESGQKSKFQNELTNEGISVGQRLREIRAMRRLSMRALAEMSGLNINTLSMIENEHTSPSVSTLQQLAQSLQVPITEFFEIDNGSKELVHQKQGQRPRVAFEQSVIEDLASGMPRFSAEPLIVTINPGADSGKNPIVHTGREFVYCIEGYITYTVKDQEYVLGPDDSLAFEAYLPHHWKNADSMPSRILLMLCSMDVRDSPTERHFLK